ncbi:MAG: hypothetical protein GEU79_09065 [Acidimicrobiia bacterium]|nr:hypothetical protein [Acidimicrobiia bacterium]
MRTCSVIGSARSTPLGSSAVVELLVTGVVETWETVEGSTMVGAVFATTDFEEMERHPITKDNPDLARIAGYFDLTVHQAVDPPVRCRSRSKLGQIVDRVMLELGVIRRLTRCSVPMRSLFGSGGGVHQTSASPLKPVVLIGWDG